MDRRDFLFKLGVGTALTLTGYFIWDRTKKNNPAIETEPAVNPVLGSNVRIIEEKGGFNLINENCSCFVNETGRTVISYLNGRNSGMDIAKKISQHYSVEYSDLLVTSVVYFISQLGSNGFLKSPYFATLYENYEAE